MRYMIALLCGVSIVLAAGIACAHPPTDITLTFNSETKILEVVITHPVSNPASHYVGKVDVSLNGRETLTQEISRQDNPTTQTVVYRIPDAKSGDIITLEAHCNLSGALARDIKVE
ncbi:MAG: hypothetical protein JW844_05975 [Candidatus Omnitrophica bacterium]|nr:hypothetical protein [Candidatus Omnitrophota bacterium]